MFSVIMLILKLLWCRLYLRIDRFCPVCHFCNLFQHDRIVYRFSGILSPGKGAVVFAQNCRNCHRIFFHPDKFLHDQPAGILLIGFCNLLRGQTAHARNFPIHVIRMCRSIAWNSTSCLGPAGRIGGMGMYDSSNLRKRPVQLQMRCRIRGRAVASFYFITVQIHHNHILRCQLIIFHAAWLNDKQPAFSVDSADVAPGKSHQTISRQIHVRFIYCFFEFFQHRFLPVFCRYFAASAICSIAPVSFQNACTAAFSAARHA